MSSANTSVSNLKLQLHTSQDGGMLLEALVYHAIRNGKLTEKMSKFVIKTIIILMDRIYA